MEPGLPSSDAEAKAIKFKKGDTKFRDNIITSTDMVGKTASMPLVNTLINSGNKNSAVRAALDGGLGIHKDANLPEYHRKTARKQHAVKIYNPQANSDSGNNATGTEGDPLSRVALFTTCYCNYNEPDIADSIIRSSPTMRLKSACPPRSIAAACRN